MRISNFWCIKIKKAVLSEDDYCTSLFDILGSNAVGNLISCIATGKEANIRFYNFRAERSQETESLEMTASVT